MKTRIGFLALGLVLVGCGQSSAGGPPPDWSVWVDPQVDQGAAFRGVTLWTEMGVNIRQAADRESANVKITARTESACLDDQGREAIEWVGRTDQSTLVITVRPVCAALWKDPSIAMQVVAAHEFGHALQLGHIPDETDALMNAGLNLNAPPYLTDADRNEFRAYWK